MQLALFYAMEVKVWSHLTQVMQYMTTGAQQLLITRCSVEHSTPHADGTPLHFTGLSYIFKNDKILPLTYVGRLWKR